MRLLPSDTAEPGTLEAIFHALGKSPRHVIGSAQPGLPVIPIREGPGAVA
jgi:hypothetical protein